MDGVGMDTSTQNALHDARNQADVLNLNTAGKLQRTKMRNESQLEMQKMSNKAGAAIDGIMAPAQAVSGIASIGQSLLGAFGSGGSGAGSFSSPSPSATSGDIDWGSIWGS